MLRAVPTPASEQRPRRSFPEMVAAIYEDPRVGHESRELLLAVAYAVDLAKREPDVSPLQVARRKLGVEPGRRARYDRLVADDAPRYKPPHDVEAQSGYCDAPRLRPYQPRPYTPREKPSLPAAIPLRPLPPTIVHVDPGYTPPRDWRTEDGVCGATAHLRVIEKAPRTGWVTAHWFCRRHQVHADRVTEQLRAHNEQAPEPVPNTGGLLPCYFKADWARVYQHYRPQWTPPHYGLSADDWPVFDDATPRPTRHSRLRVLSGASHDLPEAQ
ncbi:hypothetical protein [Streptomyces sp. NPDC015130]|uniref:hypothetical protein n=1 Tax=Streptomyces sp. NPDC015130 TaxID=3364940 RepID=UPI0036F50531